ncbi:MAG: efflux RND transporter permease subunit [Planctomycetota bacterium]|nr:efflux RND transporter permease subunit [Planctomycetota bacterium]MDA0921850.1 efflux RND transporter permease subunit [Planctomycetota bacterium]MDA1161009.1 efflux RND transporter permease subunit [Planctomycetota bacterium]
MNFIRAVVHNPVKVTVGVLLVALFGVVALLRMPLQLTPEVQTPTISVQTRWPGASPQEVEREIIIEQEEQLKSVEGLVKLSSEATDSQGTVTLEFHVGTDLEGALLKVNARLQQVREYPEEADQPVISTSNSSDRPIAWFILSTRMATDEQIVAFQSEHPELADKLEMVRKAHNVGLAMLRLRLLAKEHPIIGEVLLPYDGIDVTKLRRYAEDEIEARFERVSGVSQSNVLGGLEDEMQVLVDPEELAARQITIEDLRRVLRAQNQDTSAGDFWEGKRRWVVRTLGQFRSPEDVGNQLVAVRDGVPVYVRDVAEIELGYRKPDGIVRRFGESSIAVNCIRETGANVLDVMDGLRAMRAEIDEHILKPKGLQLVQVYDETEYIYSALDLVQQNIFIGGALTMIVLMLFLHLGIRTLAVVPFIVVSALAAAYVSSWFFLICIALLIGVGFWAARGALVVGLAIPTSIIGTFLILGLLGRSLNVVSLAGMAFAVGMLVDNAVVVLENVFRRFSEGESAFDAAINGTAEVSGAVIASTLTTIAVFLPVVFVQEEAGQLFQDIALAITGAVGLSLVVSVTLISTASARLLHRDDSAAEESSPVQTVGLGSVAGRMAAFGGGFVSMIVGFNQWVQQGTARRLFVTLGLVGASFAGSWAFWPRVEYLPNGNRNLIFAILLPPPGYNLNQLMELGQTVESNLRPYWDAVPGSEEASKLDGPIIGDFFFVARGRSVFMGLRAYEEERAAEIIPLIQRATSQLPGTFGVASQSSLFAGGLESGRTVDVEITGPDLNKLVALGGQIFGQVRELLPAGTQTRPIPSLDLSSPEVHIEPYLTQAAEMGMSANELGYTANALIDGAYAGDYFLGGDKIDLTIKGRDEIVRNAQDVEALSIATPMGQTVPLGALARVTMKSGPEQINHRERQRAITIQVTPPPEMPLEEAMILIRDEIIRPIQSSGQLDGGYRIDLAGTADKLNATWEALQFNVLLALLITYLLMAALFESWLYPFVIILSVPLGAVGGVAGLQLLNQFVLQPLDVLTMLGFVILIGTVVNNPILIVHQSLNLMREKNLPPNEAIIESVRTRVRPIFMTTLTTVLGLLPLVLFPGAGSELYRGLGSVVLGGLLVSTIFTLALVPTLFSLMLDAKAVAVRLVIKSSPSDRPSETV